MLSTALEHRSPSNIFRLGVIRTRFQKFSRRCFMAGLIFDFLMLDAGCWTEDEGLFRWLTRVTRAPPLEGGGALASLVGFDLVMGS